MRSLFAFLILVCLSGCLLDPFTSFEEIDTIPDPVEVDRQLLSFEDYEGSRAFDRNTVSVDGVISGFTIEQDETTGNSYLSSKGEGNIIVPEIDLSLLDSFTYSCWIKTYSNNSERLLSQSVNFVDTARIIIVNDRVAVGVNNLNDSAPLSDFIFNGDWVMLTVAVADINGFTPSSGALVYVNGNLVTSSTSSMLHFESGPSLKLMDHFTGDFDGLKIFDTRLDDEGIRNLYEQTKDLYLAKEEVAIVPDGLASYYRFDDGNGGVDDISQQNGEFLGDPAFGPDVTSDAGRSLEFSGNSIGSPLLKIPCSLFDNVNGFSLGFWAKTSTDAYNPMLIQGPNLFSGTHLVSFNNQELFCGNTFYCFNCGTDGGYVDAEWHHFVVTCKSINTLVEGIPMNLYVDGELIATSPNSEINFLTGEELIIGGDGSGTFFEGSLDNIRLYNRAISEEEARIIFESGS